jgi:hypothetical protein
LLLSNRDNDDRRSLLAAVQARDDARTVVCQSWRAPQNASSAERLRIYASAMFADVMAGQVGLTLLETPLAWLAGLPPELTGRQIVLASMDEVRQMPFPRHVKAIDDKRINPQVYQSAHDISVERIGGDCLTLSSRPVNLTVEARFFVSEAQIVAGSFYMRDRRPAIARLDASREAQLLTDFAADAVAQLHDTMPAGTVIDVGLIDDRQPVIVEANAAWASGLYACDPARALESILHASITDAELRGTQIDPTFIRPPPHVDFGV